MVYFCSYKKKKLDFQLCGLVFIYGIEDGGLLCKIMQNSKQL